MVNLLPAILMGGPPHAGKSVLYYNLAQALRKRGIPFHAIRACPDGEGDWSQEIDQDVIWNIRVKGEWTDMFVQRICRDLEQRLLPILVDMGGRPQGPQVGILQQCTHSLLLLRSDDPESAASWSQLAETHGLLPLARILSAREGDSQLIEEEPVVTGTLVGLERGSPATGPLFESLVNRVDALFSSYSRKDLEKTLFDLAPTELAIDLVLSLHMLAPQATRWEPRMIPALLDCIPASTALSVYGHGPQWVYAALAAHAGQASFYQFDPRLGEQNTGWVAPPSLQFGTASSPEITVKVDEYEQARVLRISLAIKHLDYLEADALLFPPVSPDAGLILFGSMPSWLVTALVRLYQRAGMPWIACYSPPLHGAVVLYSRSDKKVSMPGELIPLPPT
jgi:CRISPR-associated protein Csx3